MHPTDEQQAVIDAVHSGSNVVVQAAAGAGKTTTLRQACSSLPGSVLYLVYNKKAQQDAEKSFPKQVTCRTINGLAYQAMAPRMGGQQVLQERMFGNGRRIPSRIAAERLRVTQPVTLSGELTLAPATIARLACETIGRFCHTADPVIGARHVPWILKTPKPSEVAELAAERDRYRAVGDHVRASESHTAWDTALRARSAYTDLILPVAERAWADLLNPIGAKVRFVHDHYVKMWQLSSPSLGYDTVLLDEAQDSDPVTVDIVTHQQCQRAAIGDGCQQLYAWRGAIDALDDWPADDRLYLTQSWRFGQEIANEANKWLRLIGTPLRVRGNPSMRSSVIDQPDPRRPPNAVLCRTNGGVISQLIDALDAGRKVAVVGGVATMRSLLRGADRLLSGQRCDHPDLDLFTDWDEVRDYAGTADGADLKVFVSLVDRHGVGELERALAGTSRADRSDLQLSTAHKAKGAEWNAVTVHDDFPVPDADEEAEQDGVLSVPDKASAMLAYVTVTRAREVLDRTGLAWVDQIPQSNPGPDEPVAESSDDSDFFDGRLF